MREASKEELLKRIEKLEKDITLSKESYKEAILRESRIADRCVELQAEIERNSDALIHQGHTLRNAMNEIDKLKNIISINHQWHQDYDDCSDYKNSELFEMNTTFKVNSSEGVGK